MMVQKINRLNGLVDAPATDKASVIDTSFAGIIFC
jgi:hypothetical protein